MKSRAELKEQAKQLMSSNTILYVLAAVGTLGAFALSFIPIIGMFSTLLTLAVQFIIIRTGIQLGKGEQLNPSFYTDTKGLFRCLKSYLWMIVYILPYSLITVVGTAIATFAAIGDNTFLSLIGTIATIAGSVLMIYKEFSYVLAMYIALDDRYDHLTSKETVKLSEEMMNGHKIEYFVLSLSFIGWILLGTITFSLGMIYVIPYQSLTFANYYLEIEKITNIKYNKTKYRN